MASHYTAFVTTDPTCVDGDYCDLIILTDEILGYRSNENGEDFDQPIWESSGPQVYSAVTAVRLDEDHDNAIKDATSILNRAGWAVTGPWEAVATGYCATVARETNPDIADLLHAVVDTCPDGPTPLILEVPTDGTDSALLFNVDDLTPEQRAQYEKHGALLIPIPVEWKQDSQ